MVVAQIASRAARSAFAEEIMVEPSRIARGMRWRAAALAACAAGLVCGCARGPAASGATGGRVAALEQATAVGPRACGASAPAGAEQRQRAMWRTCGTAAQASRHACVRAMMIACG